MKITLTNIAKRFNYEWIFREINYEFTNAHNYVIIGANGSGKSTLLQVIAGSALPSEGNISYKDEQQNVISDEDIFKKLSFASPYLELFEEFTLLESIEFQAQFKPFFKGLSSSQIVEYCQLEKEQNKQLKYFSSGMKQRVRLALAILCDSPLLLLDEPTSNLDKKSIDWYQDLIHQFSKDRLIIVCSNEQHQEYAFCDRQLNIEDYKKKK